MAEARGSIRSNRGPEAQDRQDLALEGDAAKQRDHAITEAVAASTGQAGLDQGDAAKRALLRKAQQ